MATNPPITIGPFTNVPAPGSGVKSDWAQQITNYVLRTAWTGVAYSNGWADLAAGTQAVQYRKEGDRVFVRGMMKGGTLASVAFTLPVGFRPPATERFDVSNTVDNLPFVTVANTGTVTTGGLTSNATVSVEFSFSVTA